MITKGELKCEHLLLNSVAVSCNVMFCCQQTKQFAEKVKCRYFVFVFDYIFLKDHRLNHHLADMLSFVNLAAVLHGKEEKERQFLNISVLYRFFNFCFLSFYLLEIAQASLNEMKWTMSSEVHLNTQEKISYQ